MACATPPPSAWPWAAPAPGPVPPGSESAATVSILYRSAVVYTIRVHTSPFHPLRNQMDLSVFAPKIRIQTQYTMYVYESESGAKNQQKLKTAGRSEVS